MSTEDRFSGDELERVQQAVRDLGPVHVDPAFRSRLRQRFTTGAIAEDAGAVGGRGRLARLGGWMLLPTAAAAAVWLVLVMTGPGWELRDVAGAGTIVVSTGDETEVAVEASDRARLAELIRPGARIRLPEDGRLDLAAGDVLLFRLDEQAVLTLPGNPGRGEILESRLEAGELRIKTGPGFAGRRLSVQTTEGRTELSGTVVSVFKRSDSTCVCVLEGTARVGKSEATIEEVPRGMRKVMFADGRPSRLEAIEPHHLQGLTEFVEATRGVFE